MEYKIVIKGKPEGPYSLEELKNLAIQPDTFVRKAGMDDYKEAHEVAELRELLGFHYQKTAPQYFASFDQRLLAAAIDYFFITLACVFLLLLLYAFVNENIFRILTITIAILMPVIKLIYGSFAESSPKQGTVGKRLMDIKVTDLLGNRLSFVAALSRNVAKILSDVSLGFGYVYCFLNKKKQCFHDLVVGALVIKQRLI